MLTDATTCAHGKFWLKISKAKSENVLQELVRGEFWLKISISQREVFAVRNQMPAKFANVKVINEY